MLKHTFSLIDFSLSISIKWRYGSFGLLIPQFKHPSVLSFFATRAPHKSHVSLPKTSTHDPSPLLNSREEFMSFLHRSPYRCGNNSSPPGASSHFMLLCNLS